MKKNIYRVRGYISWKPLLRYDYYSRKKVLIFSLTYNTYKDGIKTKHLKRIVVKDKLINVNGDRNPKTKNKISMLDFLYSFLRKSDIVMLSGYDTNIKLKDMKPYSALRVVKYKILWSNKILEQEINREIESYNIVYHNNENDKYKEIKDNFKENKETYRTKFLFTELNNSIARNDKRNDKYYLNTMEMNKSIAKDEYSKGNKYKAISLIILNRYIYFKDLSISIKKDKKENILNLLKADFNNYDPSKYIPYPRLNISANKTQEINNL